MGGFLRYSRLPARHIRVLVPILADVLAGYSFIPDARRRKASVGIIEMVAVAAEGITKTRRPAILDCRSAIYHFHIYHFFICSFLHVARAGLDAVPHLGLVGMVAGIGGMLGVAAIRPGLHPTELCVRLVGTDGVDEHGQPGFVGRADAAVVASLLERDVVVLTVAKGLAEGDRILYDTILVIGD